MLSVLPKNGPDGRLQLHASTVVINQKAVAFLGPSGVGKSSHALALMALGAQLLADDITWLAASNEGLIASGPPTLHGRIEAWGVGILNADPAPATLLHLLVDLGTPEGERIPEPKTVTLLGHDVTLFHTPETSSFIDAIAQYMKMGRVD